MNRPNHIKATLLLLISMALASPVQAQVPETLNYQGYLTLSSGEPLVDGEVVLFSIYTVETGGSPIWSESQSVFPEQGLFSTTFGSPANPFPANMFDTPLYLGVTVSVDPEMTPRTALTSSPFSIKANDANTVGGMTAPQLDQSAEVSTLTSAAAAVQAELISVQANVDAAQADINVALSDISSNEAALGVLQTSVNINGDDLATVQTTLSTVESSLASVENTLPNLQTRVSQVCASGSAIRQISATGTVTCEVDDTSPWDTNSTTINSNGLRVGIGTTAAAASLQIDSQIDVDPFRARVGSSTKLRVHTNGSVSVGTSSAGPDNGLYVAGNTGLGTTVPTARLSSSDINWQMSLDNNAAGGSNWYLGSSADAWAAGPGKFVLSPTNSSVNPALVVNASRFVGIGTTDPVTKLHVNGGSDVTPASGGFLTLGSVTSSNVAFDNNEIMGRNNGAPGVLALNAEGGEVTINSGGIIANDSLRVVGQAEFASGAAGTLRFSASGTRALLAPTVSQQAQIGTSALPIYRTYSREYYALTSGDYRAYSDRSLKSNIESIGNAMDIVSALEGVSYALDTSPMGSPSQGLSDEQQYVMDNQLGFIAQDVEQVLPQLVSMDESSGLKTVAYMGVIPVLVEALKEQQIEIDALKDQQSQIDMLRAELDQLRKLLK